MTEFMGTASYLAPEAMQHCIYREASDIFSFGSILYAITECGIPFAYDGWSDQRIMHAVVTLDCPKIYAPAPQGVAKLFAWCWEKDPKKHLRHKKFVRSWKKFLNKAQMVRALFDLASLSLSPLDRRLDHESNS
ncbi:MAG: protein kinase [Gammaproteobacteria bacterium]|nr:protein kinase [Gammaproteobacteria bacterium]